MWKKHLALCSAAQVAVGLAAATFPDPGQETFKDCTCKSSCEASLGDLYACDSCKTEDGCGRFSLVGNWDYCKYSADEDFERQSFQQKADHFWSKITEDKSRASGYPSIIKILMSSIQTSFDNEKDEMPNGRVKSIHTVGSVCKFKLDIKESPYTGLLGPGRQEGFIRMGSAVDNKGGLTPGLGFKFARTGVHSGSFVALHSLDSGQSWNFFKYNQSNHISPPTGTTAILAKKFNQASQCAPQVGISDLAKYSQDGTVHNPPKFPFKLFMVPSREVQTPEREKTIDEVHAEMAAFPLGTTLFTVYACQHALGDEMKPTDGGLENACGAPVLLGNLVTTSECTTSSYGDKKFQIRHQRIEEDWLLEPTYLEQYNAAKACGWRGKITAAGVPRKCGVGMLDGISGGHSKCFGENDLSPSPALPAAASG